MGKARTGLFVVISTILIVALLTNPYYIVDFKSHTASALATLVLSDLSFIDQMGNKLTSAEFGQMLGIKSEILNNGDDKATFTYIIQIKDSEEFTIFLTWLEDLSIPPHDSIKPSIFWMSDYGGQFEVETFIWESMSNPIPLAVGKSSSIEITGDLEAYYDNLISEQIAKADAKLLEAYDALVNEDYALASKKALDAKSILQNAYRYYSEGEDFFYLDQAITLKSWIELYQSESTLVIKTSKILDEDLKLIRELERVDTEGEASLILPKLELISRGIKENAQDWKSYADILDFIKKSNPQFQIADEDIEFYKEYSRSVLSLGEQWDDTIDFLQTNYAQEYVPVEDREIPRSVTTRISSELVSPELAKFFESFDVNQDGIIDIGEAEEFYYWVENYVQYSYDDENELNPIVGSFVGDERLGADYRQTPNETFEEGFGDCEDMATLEQAFYNYFGIEVYVVGVNAIDPNTIDHAATIVRISDDTDEFADFLGELVYYDIGEGSADIFGNPITAGVYMLVDNAYSDAFGYLSGGLVVGMFDIHCAIPLDQGYNGEWNEAVSACGVAMD